MKRNAYHSTLIPKSQKSVWKTSEHNSSDSLNEEKIKKSKNIYWSSKLTNLLKLKKKKFFPLAETCFTKPRSIGQLVNTFKYIAKKVSNVLLNKSKKWKMVHFRDNKTVIKTV